MDLSDWGLYLLLTAAVLAAAVLHYRRGEPAGRGRLALALLRGGALALLLLLLFDPVVGGSGRSRAPVALVDASLSMRLPVAGGGTRWDVARAALSDVGADRVGLFGSGAVRALGGGDALEEERPGAPETRLASALRAALETGARVVAVTDGGIQDVDEVRALLARYPARVVIRTIGRDVQGNLGVSELEVPRWLEAGEEAAVRVAVGRVGDPVPESATVVLRRFDPEPVELARATVATPPEGGLSTAVLRFVPRDGAAEPVRLEAAVEGADAEADDDRRVAYVRISERPAGVALVSFRPDQEPRFLLPVLERALGLPVQGWMALAGGRYIRLGTGAEAGTVDEESVVRRVVAEAELKVLHGLDGGSPAWGRREAGRGRVLAFPGEPSDLLPVTVGPSRPGDWYVAGDLPPSPVAPLLAGVEPGDAPPLMALRTASAPAGSWAPLTARLARRGEPRPVVLAGEMDGRRVAVALGVGYWRLAFSGGAGRDLYDRLWSAVAGWLVEGGARVEAAGVRPTGQVIDRGAGVEWVVAGPADSLRVVLHPLSSAGSGAEPAPAAEPATAALDRTVAVTAGTARTPAVPPGTYRYEARTWRVGDGGDAVGAGAGELTVESYSPEFTRSAQPIEASGGNGDGSDATAGETDAGNAGAGVVAPATRGGRPLHATPWPYLAVVGLLCAEWILRRRWGLR